MRSPEPEYPAVYVPGAPGEWVEIHGVEAFHARWAPHCDRWLSCCCAQGAGASEERCNVGKHMMRKPKRDRHSMGVSRAIEKTYPTKTGRVSKTVLKKPRRSK